MTASKENPIPRRNTVVFDPPATLPPLSEKDFLRQVVELAEIRGWQWLHLRPGMTRDSWRTPISGPLGKGWPDLFLMRRRDKRIIFAELKRDGGKLTDHQWQVMEYLRVFMDDWSGVGIQVQAMIWTPDLWDQVEEILR